MPGPVTIACCHLGEADWGIRWGMALMALQEAEHAAQLVEEDQAERLAGRCDCCQEWPDTGLTVIGGEAVCDGCLTKNETEGLHS